MHSTRSPGCRSPTGGEVFYLDQTESQSEVQVRDWTGERIPLHVVSSGLAILAHMPSAEREEYLAGPLEPYTARTMIDPDAIRTRLEQIRSIGYVWVYGEFVEDLDSVAAAVLRPDGEPVAALHVHGPGVSLPRPRPGPRLRSGGGAGGGEPVGTVERLTAARCGPAASGGSEPRR